MKSKYSILIILLRIQLHT